MSMTVNFYGINKRENSTRIPTGTGISREVVLKSETSMLNPVFELNWNNNNPVIYNYCYCQEFARYYYIRDWVYTGRMWNAVCECDEMASFKTSILNARLYVLRSASEYDSQIIDTKYIAKTELKRRVSIPVDLGFAGASIINGAFVLGTVTRQSNVLAPTGATYYTLSAGGLNIIQNTLYPDLSSVLDNQSKLDDVPAIMLANPSQYIMSLMWFPFVPTSIPVTNIYLGYFEVANNAGILNSLVHHITFTLIPIRPNSDRGDWQKLEPYCRYYVFVPYFGVFKLPSEIAAYRNFTGDITISLVTGKATLKIYPEVIVPDELSIAPIIESSAQIGQPFPLTGVRENWEKMLGGAFNMVSGVANAAFGNYANGGMQFLGGAIESAIGIATPTAQSFGNAGGTTEIFTHACCITEYFEPTEDDNTNFGKPLCKVKRIGDLSGFCQVADGYDIDTRATPAEKNIIANIMQRGFYIE